MANEQKAKKIAEDWKRTYYVYEKCGGTGEDDSYEECYKAAMEMAEWKEQQMIEKFMKFLHTECYDARLLHWNDEIIRQKIEKAMREE